MRTGIGQTMAAAIAGLALSHTIARAVIAGLVSMDRPFLRTQKLAHARPWRQALADAREEALLTAALWLAAWGRYSRMSKAPT